MILDFLLVVFSSLTLMKLINDFSFILLYGLCGFLNPWYSIFHSFEKFLSWHIFEYFFHPVSLWSPFRILKSAFVSYPLFCTFYSCCVSMLRIIGICHITILCLQYQIPIFLHNLFSAAEIQI